MYIPLPANYLFNHKVLPKLLIPYNQKQDSFSFGYGSFTIIGFNVGISKGYGLLSF